MDFTLDQLARISGIDRDVLVRALQPVDDPDPNRRYPIEAVLEVDDPYRDLRAWVIDREGIDIQYFAAQSLSAVELVEHVVEQRRRAADGHCIAASGVEKLCGLTWAAAVSVRGDDLDDDELEEAVAAIDQHRAAALDFLERAALSGFNDRKSTQTSRQGI